MMSIPVRETITCVEIEQLIKKFKEAIEKNLSEDAAVVIEKYIVTFRTGEGEIRLITINNYVELKTRNCVVTTGVHKNFVLTRPGIVIDAPKLVIGTETITVDELVALVRRGIRKLLSAIDV